MTLFQIISLTSFTIVMALIIGRIYWLLWPRLTPATTLLFITIVFLVLIFYFGILANFRDDHAQSQANLKLSGISFNGMLFCMGAFMFFGVLAFVWMLVNFFSKKSTPGGRWVWMLSYIAYPWTHYLYCMAGKKHLLHSLHHLNCLHAFFFFPCFSLFYGSGN